MASAMQNYGSNVRSSRRCFLGVGINDYSNLTRLKTAEADVNLLERKFSSLGYRTMVEKPRNVSKWVELKTKFEQEMVDLATEAIVVHFAVHGVTRNGVLHLLFGDASGYTDFTEEHAVAAGDVVQALLDMPSGNTAAIWLILDCCQKYVDPSAAAGTQGRNVYRRQQNRRMFMFCSSGKCEPSPDGDTNSPLVKSLVMRMGDHQQGKHTDLQKMMAYITKDVVTVTSSNRVQHPVFAGDVDFEGLPDFFSMEGTQPGQHSLAGSGVGGHACVPEAACQGLGGSSMNSLADGNSPLSASTWSSNSGSRAGCCNQRHKLWRGIGFLVLTLLLLVVGAVGGGSFLCHIGEWQDAEDGSVCSATCGGGVKLQRRTVSGICPGSVGQTQYAQCNTLACMGNCCNEHRQCNFQVDLECDTAACQAVMNVDDDGCSSTSYWYEFETTLLGLYAVSWNKPPESQELIFKVLLGGSRDFEHRTPLNHAELNAVRAAVCDCLGGFLENVLKKRLQDGCGQREAFASILDS